MMAGACRQYLAALVKEDRMKIALIIVGVIVALIGFGCTVGGATLLAVAGTDGWIESDTNRLDSATYALVSEAADIEADSQDEADFIGRFHIRAEAEASTRGDAVFIGVGPAADVERYLEGVQYDAIRDIDVSGFGVGGFDVEKALIAGSREPARPGEQHFWRASASGTGKQEFDWKIEDGSYRFVLMNADASKGVDVQASAAVKIPFVGPISVALIVAGVIGLIGGVAIVVLAARSAVKPTPPADAVVPAE
jgi:hypothetical protein